MTDDRKTADRIRIGTAGWSYPDWKGQVYPKPPPRGFDPLSYLARLWPCLRWAQAVFHGAIVVDDR